MVVALMESLQDAALSTSRVRIVAPRTARPAARTLTAAA